MGDLENNKYYNLTVTDATSADLEGTDCSTIGSVFTCLSSSEGKIVFTYTGGYSDHTFEITEGDNTGPLTTASPDGGTFISTQTVTLTCNDNDGVGCDKTYYTTDGTEPTISSTEYSTPITISTTTTLKFFSTDLNGESELAKTEIYTISSEKDEDTPDKAKIDSWSAKIITDQSSCPEKLKLTIKGHHFNNDTEVKIGNTKATKTDKRSSTKLTVTFCFAKLLKVQTDHKRAVSVQNSGKDNDKADKKIDLDQYLKRTQVETPAYRTGRQFIASKNNNGDVNQDAINRVSTDTNFKPNVCNYTVKSGDTLWSIASSVYGNPLAYPLIIEKNKEKYPNIETKLAIGQELIFDCENNNQSVQGVSDEKNNPTNSNNQPSQAQPENTSTESSFKWWNPFSWF